MLLMYRLPLSAVPVVTAITESPLVAVFGRSATLSFSVTEDIPPVTPEGIVWMFREMTVGSGGSGESGESGDSGENEESGEVQGHVLDSEYSRYIFSEDRRTLTIFPVHDSDEGLYTLMATNAAGSDSNSISVDVQCT